MCPGFLFYFAAWGGHVSTKHPWTKQVRSTYNNHFSLLTLCWLWADVAPVNLHWSQWVRTDWEPLHRSCIYLLSAKHRGEVRGQTSSQELRGFHMLMLQGRARKRAGVVRTSAPFVKASHSRIFDGHVGTAGRCAGLEDVNRWKPEAFTQYDRKTEANWWEIN